MKKLLGPGPRGEKTRRGCVITPQCQSLFVSVTFSYITCCCCMHLTIFLHFIDCIQMPFWLVTGSILATLLSHTS